MNYVWNAVSSRVGSLELLLFLTASAMKATLLLGVVALLCALLRRRAAATRHLLWTLSLCAALLLPFLSIVAVWDVPVLPAQISALSAEQSVEAAGSTAEASLSPVRGRQQSVEVSPAVKEGDPVGTDFRAAVASVESPRSPAKAAAVEAVSPQGNATAVPPRGDANRWSKLVNWALVVWLAGVVLLLLRLAVGCAATRLLTRGAVEFGDPLMSELFASLLSELRLPGSVRLLRSERTLMPIVCGVVRSVVLLPSSADEWSAERRRMVLLHELTHVARRDCLTQMLAQAACAFYWFNPFVWHAARRLRVEREQACDDYVLSIGTKPSDYAHHLLEIARYLQEHSIFQWSQTTTVAMARRSQLEGRLLAILSREGKRRAMSQLMTAGVTAFVFVLFLSLAVVRPTVGSAHNPQSAQNASSAETGGAEKSSSGLRLKNGSAVKGEAIIQGAEMQGQGVPPGRNAHTEDDSPVKILNGAEAGDELRQESQAVDGRNLRGETTESVPPQLGSFPQAENFPVPTVVIPPVPTIKPFLKVGFQEQRQSSAQDSSEDYIAEMAAVGFTNLSIDELVNLKVTGVTAAYVRSLRALGLNNLTTRELSAMSVHGVTPAFIQSIRDAGYRELAARDLTTFRIHDITPDFINRLRKAGYDNLSARQLTEFAVQQVTPEFIAGMRAVGYGNLSPRELVTLRVHDITPEFVRAARKRLGDLNIKQIITLKIEGLLDGSGDE